MRAGGSDVILETLYNLDEPWRSRFLVLVAKMATRGHWGEREPTREEMKEWLRQSGVREATVALLREWGSL